jgi:hypothetical protein
MISSTSASVPSSSSAFVSKVPERGDLNQYWYSAPTIDAMVEEINGVGGSAAFLSTPSVYFSIPSERRGSHYVFDLDTQFSTDRGFVLYDFKKPEEIPSSLHHSFDIVVIDPPFITSEVWELYAKAARLLLKVDSEGKMVGKVLASTIAENDKLLADLLDAKPQRFAPSIPHLVYQYCFFCNYETTRLCLPNPEIPE